MESKFLCAVAGKLGGDPGDLKEARVLNRVVRWTPEGIRYEVAPRHYELLVWDLEACGEGSVRQPLSSPAASGPLSCLGLPSP